MKTSANGVSYGGLALCLCLVFLSVTARCQPTFGGVTAYSSIDLQGNNVTMDSFNSADPNHSIWQTGMTWHGMPYGVYSDTLSYISNSLPSRTANFTVATDGQIIGVDNANIYGYVNTAPGGFVEVNVDGEVGDLNWVYNGLKSGPSPDPNIEPGHIEDNMNAVFYSRNLPVPVTASQTNWWSVPAPPGGSTNIGGVTYSLLITNLSANSNFVYYSMGTLTQNIFIDASNVVLYLTNGMHLAGSQLFTLNSNADASIYSSGNIGVSGLGGISNLTENAHALSIYDVAGYTNLTFSIGGGAIGTALIYAPSSSVSFSGGGVSSYGFVGAIFCNSFVVSGHYLFHYDESLGSESLPIPPWISQQPTNQIVQVGTDATFNIAAGGSLLTYQWFFSQGLSSDPIPDETNASLTMASVQLTNAGNFFVVASDAFGSVTSSPASLIVYSNATATLSGALSSTNEQFQLAVSNIDNVAGMPYVIEASTNLTDWAPIMTNGTPFVYTETNSFPQRYYRAVFVP